MRNSTKEEIIDIIVDKLSVDRQEITPTANFIFDLGADSLDTVELMMEFEKEFNISIPTEISEQIQTVQDAMDQIEKLGMRL